MPTGAIQMRISIELSEEHKLKVYDDLSHGSNPKVSFFFLVAVSTMIAAFGLVMNSTAVVIGAMLVAPLMTPILGLALALIRGDAHLLGLGARSEALGVIVSLSAGALLGLALPSHFQPTPEMLARVSPNLLDLLVAVFAGLAGAYALVDKRLSPVLPGVAISTAIVPPLANSGMCLALGAYQGALGSFLLFFTNFLSILLVSGLVFFIAGMGEELRLRTGLTIARRFSLVGVGLAVVAVLLASELIKMFEDRRLRIEVTQALETEFGALSISDLNSLQFQIKDGTLMVLVDIDAGSVIEPREVQVVQNRLADDVGKPIELFVRTTMTHDVSASGSTHQAVAQTLDGFRLSGQQDQRISAAQTAEQVIREYLDEQLDVHLESLQVYPEGTGIIVVAEIAGSTRLRSDKVSELEALINDRMPPLPIRVITRQEVAELQDSESAMRLEVALPRLPTSKERDDLHSIFDFIRSWLDKQGFWLRQREYTILEGQYHILLEVTGPMLFTSDNLASLKGDLLDALDLPLELYVRSVPEAVVGPQGYTSMEELLSGLERRNRTAYPKEYEKLIRESF